MRRFIGLLSVPVICALAAWLWVGIAPAGGPAGAAGLSMAVAPADEPKPKDKKTDDKKSGEEKSDNQDKGDKGKDEKKSDDKPGGKKEADQKESQTKDKEAKDQKTKDQAKEDEKKKDQKKKTGKKTTGGALSDEDLAKMKRMLMERVQKTGDQSTSQPAPSESEAAEEEAEKGQPAESQPAPKPEDDKPEPAEPSTPEAGPAAEPEPVDEQEDEAPSTQQEGEEVGEPDSAKAPRPHLQSRPGTKSLRRAVSKPKGSRPERKPVAAPSTAKRGAQPEEDGREPAERSSRRRARGGPSGKDEPRERDEPTVIMPIDLPEGKRAWDMPEDWRPFFFSFDNVPIRDVLDDWSRMAGLSILNLGKAKGQLTYQSLEYMNYWEAFALLNELLADESLQLHQEKHHLRLVSPSEIREYITGQNTFTSRGEFEQAHPHEYAIVKVFFVPPANVAPSQVAQWINDLPESVRLGSSAEGHMHVSGNAKDVRKLFRLVDIVNVQVPVEGLRWRWIPVENVDVNQAANLARQFVDTQATPQPRSSRKRGAPAVDLEDYAEVDVIAVPKSQMLLVRARTTTLDRIEALVREIDGRYIEKVDVEPVIIPLQHARAEEIIPLLESILTGEAVSGTGRGATKTSVRRKKGAAPGADELDLSPSQGDIQLLPEPNTNSLIVIADQEGLERVRKLLEVFDVPSIAPVFERVALKHAEVETVQQVLTTLYGGKRKKGSSSVEQLTVIPELAAIALFLAGMEDVVIRAHRVIEQMDVETASSVTHLVTLVNQTPTALAQILNQMETGGRRKSKASVGAEGVKIIGDDATATLIVVCPDTRWPELKELIETLDRDVEDFLVTRTFKIKGADAQQVANLLKEMFGGRSGQRKGKKAQPEGVTISVDPTGNLIFVRGEEETIERMAAVIQEMEAEVASRETIRRTFQLVYTSASDMVKALTTFYPATSPGRGKSKIVPGEATFAPVGRSTVVVETTLQNMEEIVALIGELDTEAGDQGEIRSFVVKDADPQQVVRALQSMFEARGGGKRKGAAAAGPSFTALGKKIIVVAEPALFGRIAEAIAQFEGEGPAIEYRRFPVQYADAEELGKLVEDLLNTRAASTEISFTPVKGGKGRKATTGGVTVSADPRTKTLFVAAPAELMTYAEELIEALDAPQPEDVEELIVRTVQLERAEVGEMIDSLRQIMSGRAEATPKRPAGKKVARTLQAQAIGKMKGTVSMVPAPGADAVILRGIESDVDQVEKLIVAIDAAALSQRKVARRYDAMPTGMGADELADTIMAVADGAKPSRKDAAEDEFAIGPRIGKDLVITTDWYTDMVLVIATPEKQTEVELLLEALSYDTEGPEGESSRWPIQMVEIAHADPYDVRDAIEEVVDDIVERGPKTRVRVIEGANMLSLTGPADQIEAILEVIATMDVPGRKPPPALVIRSVSSPVPLERVLQLVQQQLPDVELEIEGAGQVLPGYGVEEVPVVEEILPTLGPNTLAYISAELQRLALAASDEEKQGGKTAKADESPPEPEAQAEPESEASDQPPAPPKVKIYFDPKTGTFRLQGPPRYVEQVSDAIDEVLDELKKLPIKPDIRVFRIKYANVNDVAQIMESILGAQSGGAASRRQQQLAQQLRLQQQMLRQRQTQQQQAQMRRMMQQMGQKEEQEPEKEEEEPKEHEDEAKEFGTTRVRIYPDPRTSTIIVRAAPEDYPTIVGLIAKIDKQGPQLTDFRIFKLTKLKAADVETAIKAILRLDRQAARVARPRPGQRPGQPQTGGQMQMIAQLQQELAQAQQAGAEGAVSINWAEQVTITSDTPTNSILASGPTQAIDYIESMIEKLEGQEIEKEAVKTIQLVHTTVEEALPVLTETFAPRGATGGAGGRLRMPGGAGQQEAVQTAVSQVIITGDSRTNTLIVKAVERDMAEVEALIARLDVDTGDEGRMQPYRLRYADAASMAKALNEIYASGERGQKTGRVRIVADASTNSILLSAPPTLREEIIEQIRSLDTIKGEESKPRTIAITAGNAETIAQKLQQVFGKRGQLASEVSILGDNVAEQLVVVAPDAVFQQIATLVGSMDKAGSEAHIQIYELEHALAEETLARMQEMIKQMAMNKALYGAGKDVDLDTFAATADPRTNSIVVMGSPGTHLLIGSTLAKMDVPPKGSTQVATAIFPLVVGDANDVARQVQQLFATRARTGGEPPVATPNPGMNTLIVRGTQAQLDEVQKLINDLEGLTPPGQGELESYTVRLLYAKAEDVANTLNEYFRKKFEAVTRGGVKGVKPTDLQVTITPDINSNQIFVTASELNKAEIDQLLSTMDVEGAGAQTTGKPPTPSTTPSCSAAGWPKGSACRPWRSTARGP